MKRQNEQHRTLIKLILPEKLFDFFLLVGLKIKDKQVHIYLEEKDLKQAWGSRKTESKGFSSAYNDLGLPA